MAFDYGSIDLGLKNPFKTEGLVTAVRGVVQTILGLYLLLTAASIVKENTTVGWVLMVFGIFILTGGITAVASGVYARLRFFVGRNHPTSLAYNFSKSETTAANDEKDIVGYNKKQLEEMLVGRKNSTFVEPIGFIARLIHSFIPKLVFLPYPIRNVSQRIISAWISTIISLLAYGLVAFVSLNGFAGEAGELAFPFYSFFLMLYLLMTWRSAGKPIVRAAEKKIEALGSTTLVKIISLSVILPISFGIALSWLMSTNNLPKAEIENFINQMPSLNVGWYLFAVILIAALSSLLAFVLLNKRLSIVNPITEVSELRENWQESVHPNEIFINLDNLVMANRRYKEVPNRVYLELDPQLQEQADDKGGFKGEMIQEVQPNVKPMALGDLFNKVRVITLVTGNIFYLIASVFTMLLAYQLIDIYTLASASNISTANELFESNNFSLLLDLVVGALHLLLLAFLVKSFGRLLATAAHLFFAEMQFESLLVYFKCEGTFTESKISTGTGIHDSTRSENTLVRSSITPWVIVSKIVSTTFAATGMQNLEHPRHILEMHKDEEQLKAIKNDVISFLKNRESIASITSERDLGNASQIHQLNQQTRAMNPTTYLSNEDDDAAGYLRQEENLKDNSKESKDS
ncbi:hypothetical protein [Colwellia echini]|uniref:Orphan protein membrane protein n=1 Tax=Colwellia echini TaxID=1982103 RepID=A0ABY3MSQ9_9GAMM|nr:hypothetical protein [Colwellia echini]TYK64235.1 hypothetical protein CWS31_016740 [Colwellia echini]